MYSKALVKSNATSDSQTMPLEPLMGMLKRSTKCGTASNKNHTMNSADFYSTPLYNMSGPGKLLNSFLKACYQLDSSICCSSHIAQEEEVNTWQTWDPFSYLSSPTLLKKWEHGLDVLCQQYLSGSFTPDIFEDKLVSIMSGVELLQDAREKIKDELEHELEKCGVEGRVPEVFWEAIEERCAVLDEGFLAIAKSLDNQD